MPYRFALVTGATSGIGAAFARALPAETNLLLTARDAGALARAQQDLSRPGRIVEAVPADLATDEGRQAVIDKAEALGIDLLVNNAGVGAFGAVIGNRLEDERATVELNVTAVTVLTRALLPGLIDRAAAANRRAGLILLSSTTAFQPVPYLATYAATKAFILSYGEALASELRRKPVDVLVLCPGATRTGFGAQSAFDVRWIPGADDPDAVARAALSAIGRRTVHVMGLVKRSALAPFLWSRHTAAGGLGALLSAFDRSRSSPRP